MLQLYPELPGSQEFHPWKSSTFFLSLFLPLGLSGKFCKLSAHRSCHSHMSTFTQGLHARTDTQFCSFVLFFFALLAKKKSGWTGAGVSAGVAEVTTERKWPRPECMAADTTRHVPSPCCSFSFFFSLVHLLLVYLLPPFCHVVAISFYPSSLSSSFSRVMPD